ncbi:bifunctional 4-hydroxy-2-oxoglutarate aldolase/2-dehydro-3-deoxy-phosphogluconate aldolase [Sphingobacterium sp. HMA12]|uniref:bifunctional 4-hydroxy-2-oxoglutarate aldolase/2-dehydro-3-deoxy-phosphogluconate aldolase n=1 Tax=Sphingobacterium sp. HMA12 TaxID=2050894 RepID=UPI000CE9F2AF|nr:bifunctional 4-hydroxy-2-oxoglutarate aldolase/2-dehydro-3-deoxy-phosphogluconate aldolase [Sphingobacterium sp. HMA12]
MQEVLTKIAVHPIIPVFYDNDIERCFDIVEQCYEGGVRVFEFVNRGAKAMENFNKLNARKHADLTLGIGTIKSAEDAQHFLNEGADFIVSPIVDPEIATVCQEKGKLWIPGCMTPTEINTAEKCGVSLIKLFPGDVLGPNFLKAVKPLFPNLQFMVTGGIKLEQSNLDHWFGGGAAAVGIGSSLFEASGNHAGPSIAEQLQVSFSYLRQRQ